MPIVPPEIMLSVFKTLRLLIPRDLTSHNKRRFGGNDDGGYVMVDCFRPEQVILSLGVGPDVSFDLQLAEQGHRIVMFDHTVDALPTEHPNFTWHRIGVAAQTQPDGILRSLDDLADMLPNTGADPILKMDVEGAEWDALNGATPATLRRFAQISIELHNLLQLDQPAFREKVTAALEKLMADFVLIHVHGNDCDIQGHVGGFVLPNVLEISLIRRDLVQTVPSQTWYPTNLDRSNWRGASNYLLYYFPFAPGSETLELASFGA
jgi:hypothetical protein